MPTPRVPKKGGKSVSSSSRKRYRSKLLQFANWAFGGSWQYAETSPGRIVIVDSAVKNVRTDIASNALAMCKLRRYSHMPGGQARDLALGRTVPWSCVTACWEYLKGPVNEQPVSYSAHGFPFATRSLDTTFQHMLACMQSGWRKPD